MKFHPCTHKNYSDHTVGRGADDRLIWKCSSCGITGGWTEGWSYYGNIECRKCWTAEIGSVICPTCPKPDEKPIANAKKKRSKPVSNEEKVPGGVVIRAEQPHMCSPPDTKRFSPGDKFRCDCGATHILKDAQSYQGGAFWSRLPAGETGGKS